MITTSSSSPVSSEIFAALALLFLSGIVLLILRHYLPLRTTPAYVLTTVFFALWLPAAIVLLVPIDLASNARTEDEATRGVWLPERVIQVAWRISYWLTFSLTWFILPILAEYSDAGYRDPQAKLLYSLRSNAQYYATIIGLGILGLVYVFLYYGVQFDSLKAPVMALAYCWGLILAIYLMGHGLVAIPRGLIRNASISGRLRRLQERAVGTVDRFEDAEMKLEDLEITVAELGRRRKTGSAVEYAEWIEELMDLTNNLDETATPASGVRGTGEAQHLPTVITEKYMADLTRNLLRAKQARGRYAKEWADLVAEYARTQAVLDSGPSKRLTFGTDTNAPTMSASFTSRWSRSLLTPYTRFLLHFHILPILRYPLAAFLGLASFCIIWSEIVKSLPSHLADQTSIIRLTVVRSHATDSSNTHPSVSFTGQLLSALWILYMSTAALTSITQVRVWRGRALVPRNTSHESAFWYASYVARLSVPLSYNFITFLSRDVYEKTRFYDFLGRLINLTPLGDWFDRLFPLFILVPVAMTGFGLYGRMRRWIGFGNLVDDGDSPSADEYDEVGESGGRRDIGAYGTGSWREGRDLLERELNGTSIRAAASVARGESRPERGVPIRSVPGARGTGEGATTPFSTSPNTFAPTERTSARAGRTVGGGASSRAVSRSVFTDEDGEDEGFFASFGHRLKNTVDTIDTPKWLQDISKPKWMGNSSASGTNGGSGGSGSSRPNVLGRAGSDVRRWFGGGGNSGIRI